MRIFDFFRAKKAKDSREQDITFRLKNADGAVLAGCKQGDYINLWTKTEMDKVNIYAPNSIGGSGLLGTVPSNYFRPIKAHLLTQKDFGFSGPSTNNYEATIIELTPSDCTIAIRLFSPREHEQRIHAMVEREKLATKLELEKKYRMSKTVEIRFEIKSASTSNLDKVRLKVFDKEFYIEHPYDYKLQLVDSNNMIVGETFSQKDKVFRVVKAHLNGQSLKIEKIEKNNNHLKVTVA